MSQTINLQQTLNHDGVGICTKTRTGRVLSQNKHSIRYCGNQHGNICQKGCMEYLAFNKKAPDPSNPHLLFQRAVGNRSFDIVFITSQNHLISLLNPIHKTPSIPDKLKTITSFGCTPREFEIATLMLRGYTNQEICKKLFISRPTLKTHINRLYKKLGDHNCSFTLR